MVKKNTGELLKLIKRMKGNEFSNFIDAVSDNTVDEICECVYNVVNSNLKFGRRKKLQLKRHIRKNCSVHRIRKIMNKKIPVFKRRKALKMEGRGLPMLLASAIPFVIDLIGGLFKKK